MNYALLGSTGLRISRVSMGCMSLTFSHASETESIIHEALALGINFFDTADLYEKGMNETMVGRAIKHHRSSVILATKVGNQWRADGSGWDWNPSKIHIIASIEDSLRRLQTDYIDLYQLHGGTLEDPIDDAIDAFETLVRSGKIRHYGISSIRPNVIRAYAERSRISSVMTQYSLLDRRPEEAILPFLHGKHIGVLARGSLAQGLLIDKPEKTYQGHPPEQVAAARLAIQQCSMPERSPAQTALGFVLANPAVTSAVVGIRQLAQLREIAAATGAPQLETASMDLLRQSAPLVPYQQHR